MRIVVGREEFLRVLTLVKRVPAKGDVGVAALKQVLVCADSVGGIVVSATDLVTRLDAVVQGEVELPGSVTVLAPRLVMVFDSLPDGPVTVSIDDNHLITLEGGDSIVHLYGGDATEFPAPFPDDEVVPVVIEQAELSRFLGSVAFAMSEDGARHNLCGTRLEFDAGCLVCAATDGRRISVNEIGVSWGGDALAVTVPSKTVLELLRSLGREGDVRVGCTETRISFSFDGVRLTSGLVDGNYPNIESVFSKELDRRVELERTALIEVLGRAVALSTKQFHQVRLVVEAGVIHVDCVTPEVGDYHEDVSCVYDGALVEVTLEPLYMIDVLAHVETERVCLLMKDAASQVMVVPHEDEEALVYRSVIQPIYTGPAGEVGKE